MGFGISGVEPLCSAIGELVTEVCPSVCVCVCVCAGYRTQYPRPHANRAAIFVRIETC